MIPQNYNDWQHCITVDCKIEMTPQYVAERLKILSDERHDETKNFVKLYGQTHCQNVVAWFRQFQSLSKN